MILLDTHVVIWLSSDPARISPTATDALQHAQAEGELLAVSAITIFEIASEIRKGRVLAHTEPKKFFDQLRSRIRVVPISEAIARCAGELPKEFTSDPMDRLITATAIIENAPLITADTRIRNSGECTTVW